MNWNLDLVEGHLVQDNEIKLSCLQLKVLKKAATNPAQQNQNNILKSEFIRASVIRTCIDQNGISGANCQLQALLIGYESEREKYVQLFNEKKYAAKNSFLSAK